MPKIVIFNIAIDEPNSPRREVRTIGRSDFRTELVKLDLPLEIMGAVVCLPRDSYLSVTTPQRAVHLRLEPPSVVREMRTSAHELNMPASGYSRVPDADAHVELLRSYDAKSWAATSAPVIKLRERACLIDFLNTLETHLRSIHDRLDTPETAALAPVSPAHLGRRMSAIKVCIHNADLRSLNRFNIPSRRDGEAAYATTCARTGRMVFNRVRVTFTSPGAPYESPAHADY